MCNAKPAEGAGNLAAPHNFAASVNRRVSNYRDIYTHYFPILEQTALGLGLSGEDAEDLAQDTLVEAYKNLNISKSQSNGTLETELLRLLHDLLAKLI